jgi:uncharacterized protein with ParB-like and HNH nuclease domain
MVSTGQTSPSRWPADRADALPQRDQKRLRASVQSNRAEGVARRSGTIAGMEAAEAKIQRVLEGSKQFLVPHYQRPYSWKEEQWKTLWHDILELIDDPASEPHFLASIVTSPARSIPEGVEKRLLIDGQQRLTTLLVLLTLIRDRARDVGATKLAERIQDLVTNRHEDGNEHYKLLPTQSEDAAESDREAFVRMVAGTSSHSTSGIRAAYEFFASKLRRSDAPDLEELQRVIVSKFTLVSIILDERDNPHRIFESLNGKGRPLSQADLIRNYFFMRLPEKDHERVYLDLWRPMQKRLGEDALTAFVRHFLTRSSGVIRETDVYAALKARVDSDTTRSPVEHLEELARFSEYYEILLNPTKATSSRVRDRLHRLNRLEVTVAYPFLLAAYADSVAGKRTEEEFCLVLDTIENFLVRRFVCGIPTHGLNKVFAGLYEQTSRTAGEFISTLRKTMSSNARAYPRDDEFRERLDSARLYGGGDRREKTKLILERLEAARGHKEPVPGPTLTIEHVMPQSLSDTWMEHLGSSWEEDHEQFLHTLGNLTLTNYNAELSNLPFAEKKKLFATSHVELNRYFEPIAAWTATEIERRSEVMTDLALSLWPYFGPHQIGVDVEPPSDTRVTGTVPSRVRLRGDEAVVQSWVDVAIFTMEAILKTGEEEFSRVAEELPKFVNRDATVFRRSSRLKKLSNGAYLEANHSASTLHRLCVQAVQLAGLGSDWSVEFGAAGAEGDDDEGGPEASSQVKQLQLEFWTAVRASLLETSKFASLQSPRPRYWFDVALGRGGIHMSFTANTMDGLVGARIVLSTEKADQVLELLLAQRHSIETELGVELEWNPYPQKRQKTIRIARPANLLDHASWPAAIEWLTKTAVALHASFAPRVAQLDLRLPT